MPALKMSAVLLFAFFGMSHQVTLNVTDQTQEFSPSSTQDTNVLFALLPGSDDKIRFSVEAPGLTPRDPSTRECEDMITFRGGTTADATLVADACGGEEFAFDTESPDVLMQYKSDSGSFKIYYRALPKVRNIKITLTVGNVTTPSQKYGLQPNETTSVTRTFLEDRIVLNATDGQIRIMVSDESNIHLSSRCAPEIRVYDGPDENSALLTQADDFSILEFWSSGQQVFITSRKYSNMPYHCKGQIIRFSKLPPTIDLTEDFLKPRELKLPPFSSLAGGEIRQLSVHMEIKSEKPFAITLVQSDLPERNAKDNCEDGVALYDDSPVPGRLMTTICGQESPEFFTSGRNIYITYKVNITNVERRYSGWSAYLKPIPTQLSVNEHSETFFTPSIARFRSESPQNTTMMVNVTFGKSQPGTVMAFKVSNRGSIYTSTCDLMLIFYDGPSESSPVLSNSCVGDELQLYANGEEVFLVVQARVTSIVPQTLPQVMVTYTLESNPVRSKIGYGRCDYQGNDDMFTPPYTDIHYGSRHWGEGHPLMKPYVNAEPSILRRTLSSNEWNVQIYFRVSTGLPARQKGGDCGLNRLTFYDGPSENSTMLATVCGSDLSEFWSSGNQVHVVLQIQPNVSYGELNMKTCVFPKLETIKPKMISSFGDTFKMLSYGNVLSSGRSGMKKAVKFSWETSSDRMDVVVSHIDMRQPNSSGHCIDKAIFYDGPSSEHSVLATLCGNESGQHFYTSGPELYLSYDIHLPTQAKESGDLKFAIFDNATLKTSSFYAVVLCQIICAWFVLFLSHL